MPVPIICLDDQVRQFAERFRHHLSKPQYQYFVIVLLGLMLCEGTRTLSGLLRQIAHGPILAGLSRDLAEAPWEPAAVAEERLKQQPIACDANDPNFTNADVAYNWFKCGDRFSYGTAVAVLLGMIGALSAGVIAILRKRDIQR